MLRIALAAEVDAPRPGPSGPGGRSARSLIDTMQPSAVWATCASGAAARNRFIAPHSSASRWPNVIQRNRSSGITVAIGLGHRREHAAWSGVEQQRLVGVDEELVERETGRADVGHERGQAVDAVGDLVDACFHDGVSFSQRGVGWLRTPVPGRRPERVRMKSRASISTRSPSTPWLNLPPAGPRARARTARRGCRPTRRRCRRRGGRRGRR